MAQEREGNLPQAGQAGEQPQNVETPHGAFRQLITPVDQRFVRSHFAAPAAAPDTLSIGGAVAHPRTWTLAALRDAPAVTLTVTTECAGNHRTLFDPAVPGEQWTGRAVSTSQWTGVPLERLLAAAGLKESAAEVAFHSADAGFARSLPRAKALDHDTLIAWELNGEPVPSRFGGPLRLIVPGWYGMASVKWLARIEALDAPFTGEYQVEKYVYGPGQPVTAMRVKSMFLDPAHGATVRRGRVRIRGLAWGGEGGLMQVEIRIGREAPRLARILGPALPHAWRRFELDWDAKAPGSFELSCCATDVAGNVQPEKPEWNPLGYGANAVQRIRVDVR